MITAAPELASNESATTTDVSLDPKCVGSWDAPFPPPNVAIHTHVLPNGKVLFWGRRDHPGDSLDTYECTPHLWDPGTKQLTVTPQPSRSSAARTAPASRSRNRHSVLRSVK